MSPSFRPAAGFAQSRGLLPAPMGEDPGSAAGVLWLDLKAAGVTRSWSRGIPVAAGWPDCVPAVVAGSRPGALRAKCRVRRILACRVGQAGRPGQRAAAALIRAGLRRNECNRRGMSW